MITALMKVEKDTVDLLLASGHKRTLLLLILFQLAFFLEVVLGFLLLFLIAFIFTTTTRHNELLSVNGWKHEAPLGNILLLLS